MSKHDQIFSCANFFNNAWNRCKQHFMFLFFFSSFSSNAAPSVDCISQTFYTYKILVDPFITISSSLKCLMNYISLSSFNVRGVALKFYGDVKVWFKSQKSSHISVNIQSNSVGKRFSIKLSAVGIKRGSKVHCKSHYFQLKKLCYCL